MGHNNILNGHISPPLNIKYTLLLVNIEKYTKNTYTLPTHLYELLTYISISFLCLHTEEDHSIYILNLIHSVYLEHFLLNGLLHLTSNY